MNELEKFKVVYIRQSNSHEGMYIGNEYIVFSKLPRLPTRSTIFAYQIKNKQNWIEKESYVWDGKSFLDIPTWLKNASLHLTPTTNDTVDIDTFYKYLCNHKRECIQFLLSTALIKEELPGTGHSMLASALSDSIFQDLFSNIQYVDQRGHDHLFLLKLKVSAKTMKNMITKNSNITSKFIIKNKHKTSGESTSDSDYDCGLLIGSCNNLTMSICRKEDVIISETEGAFNGIVEIKNLLMVISLADKISLKTYPPQNKNFNIKDIINKTKNEVVKCFDYIKI